jgi:ribonuclease HI
LSGRLVK